MESLINACHRSVLFSIIDIAKDAPRIAEELNISLSAVYKTLSKLEELTLLSIELANTSALINMPLPPPKGVSSTVLCLSNE